MDAVALLPHFLFIQFFFFSIRSTFNECSSFLEKNITRACYSFTGWGCPSGIDCNDNLFVFCFLLSPYFLAWMAERVLLFGIIKRRSLNFCTHKSYQPNLSHRIWNAMFICYVDREQFINGWIWNRSHIVHHVCMLIFHFALHLIIGSVFATELFCGKWIRFNELYDFLLGTPSIAHSFSWKFRISYTMMCW